MYLPDGLIYDFITTSEVVNYGDEIYLTIIRNLKYVILPDFHGWYYEDVLSFLQKNEINVELIYIELFYKEDYVIGQSVDAGSKVLKRSNPVIIYIAKRS